MTRIEDQPLKLHQFIQELICKLMSFSKYHNRRVPKWQNDFKIHLGGDRETKNILDIKNNNDDMGFVVYEKQSH